MAHGQQHALSSAPDHTGTLLEASVAYDTVAGHNHDGVNSRTVGVATMDASWTPTPQGPVAGQSTRAGQANYEGGSFYNDFRVQFNRVLIRLTAATPITAAGRLLIMQTSDGRPASGANLANLKATCAIAVPGVGAQNVEITPSEGTVTLVPGIFYVIWVETSAGITMRTYGTYNYDLLCQSMQANYVPNQFTTNIAGGGIPATLNPLETGSGGQSTATTNNVVPVIRFRKV